ncbi:MAG: hypothetical protein FWC42_11280 [Proteobacteria bacterium]|nr:hypothetical protein [Pseudomonadota bacterium]
MKKRKLKISLVEFLQNGNFGPFIPRQDCSPEDVIAILGKPSAIEVHAMGKEFAPYTTGDASLFPVIVCYGSIEFHFDSPSTLYTIHSDTPFDGVPIGGSLKLLDSALLRFGRTMSEFLHLAKERGITILNEPVKTPHWSAWEIKTNGGITLHFENDDPEEASNAKAPLRAFSWRPGPKNQSTVQPDIQPDPDGSAAT